VIAWDWLSCLRNPSYILILDSVLMQDPFKFITRLQLALRGSVTSTTKCFASTSDPLCLEILRNNGICPRCWSRDLDNVIAEEPVLLGYNALPRGSRITTIRDTVVSSLQVKIPCIHVPTEAVAYPGILFGGGGPKNTVVVRGQRTGIWRR